MKEIDKLEMELRELEIGFSNKLNDFNLSIDKEIDLKKFKTFEHILPEVFDLANNRFINKPIKLEISKYSLSFIDQVAGNSIKEKGLQSSLEKLIASNPLLKKHKNNFQIALVNLNDKFNPKYAGWNDLKVVSGASVPKIVVIYALFQLLNDLKHILKNLPPIRSKSEFNKILKSLWSKFGVLDMPDVDKLFDLLNSRGLIDDIHIKKSISNGLDDFKVLNSNWFHSKLIDALSFDYIGSLLLQTGLFHSITQGIWIRSNYSGKEWRSSPVKGGFSIRINALSVAAFYTLLAQERLINRISSQGIKKCLEKGCITSNIPLIGSKQISLKCGIHKNACHDTILFSDKNKRGVVIVLTDNPNTYLNAILLKELYDILPKGINP